MTDFLDRWPRFSAAFSAVSEHNRAGGAGYKAAINSIGDEILPAILGDAWIRPQRQPWFTDLSHYAALVDHPEYFRRAGTRGPATWRHLVLVSQPYGGFTESAIVEAHKMRERKIPVGAWGAPRVGPWNAPGTDLILIAPELIGKDATRFGFVDLIDRA